MFLAGGLPSANLGSPHEGPVAKSKEQLCLWLICQRCRGDVFGYAGEAVASADAPPETLTTVMQRLELLNKPENGIPRTVSCSASAVPLGRFHKIWNRTLKMTCKRHTNCSLMVEPWWFPDSELVLYRWIALAKYANVDVHMAESRRLSVLGQANGKAARASGNASRS